MRRREFIALVGSAVAAWPLAARAQRPASMRRVGVLMSTREDDPDGQVRAGMINKGLEELGWTEGRNIELDFRWAGGDPVRASSYAAELVRLKPDVIVANSTLCLKAVRDQTRTIPIVFVVVGDPFGQGFVSNLAHPDGNVTGFTGFEFGIGGMWLEMIKAIAPDVRRVAFIFNPEAGLPYGEKFAQSMKARAPALGVEVLVSPVRNAADVDRAIADMGSEPNGGLIVNPDAFTGSSRGLLISLAARYRLPAIYAYRYYVVDGGLMSYGHETNDWFRQSAAYVDKILKGVKLADLPIQNPTQFELIINRKTASALGLTIPDKVLALADEVIE
jgi:putative tryptophan/tyrosine transport system substrate-binding protein